MEPLEISEEIRERIQEARSLVAFSGAGVSRESGLDTFRGAGGLWETMRPEELATPQAFRADPEKVWRWYAWRFRQASEAAPNPAHLALARLETEEVFPVFTLVTQNVDGLHRRAGSRNVLELHGTILRAHCNRCGRSRDMGEAIAESPEEPPVCTCGGKYRPSVVWFGEALPDDVFARATEESAYANVFVSIGTSSTVYPAAGLIEVAKRAGAVFIEVNPEPTPFSRLADLRLAAPAGEAVPALVEALARYR